MEIRKLVVELPAGLHKKLSLYKVKRGVSMKKVVIGLLEQHFKKGGDNGLVLKSAKKGVSRG